MEKLNVEKLKEELNNNENELNDNNYQKLLKNLSVIFFNLFSISLLVCSFYTYFSGFRNIWVYILWAYTINTFINKITSQLN